MAEQPNTQPRIDNFSKYAMQKCQLNAAVGGLIPFLAYGIFYIWGIYEILKSPWHFNGFTWHAYFAFFIGNAVGTVIGFFMIQKYKKSVMYASSALMILGSGVLLMPENDNYFLTASISRYMGGIGQGIALFTMLIHLPEVASKSLRGSVVAGISCMLATSYFIVGSMNTLMDTNIDVANFSFGAMIILLSALGLCFMPCFTLESPVYLLQNNLEQRALKTLMRLRLQKEETYELREDLQELKDYINDEKCLETVKFEDQGRSWFIKILSLRILYIASTSIFLTNMLWEYSRNMSEYFGPEILMSGRFVVELLVLYFVEKFGRRSLLHWSLIGSGLTMAVMSLILLFSGPYSYHGGLIAFNVFSTIYQLFIGLGIAPISLIYLSELFSIKRKYSAIMFILIIENILQIFFAIPLGWNLNQTLICGLVASAQIGGGYYFHKVMPETKGLSLRECLHALK